MIQYWKHKITGEIYAVDILDHEITNAYGPILDTPVSRLIARNLDFNSNNTVDLDWLKNSQDDFTVIGIDD